MESTDFSFSGSAASCMGWCGLRVSGERCIVRARTDRLAGQCETAVSVRRTRHVSGIFPKSAILLLGYEARHVEEGGPLHALVSAYMLVELPMDVRLRLPENYFFMTFAQLSALNAYGDVNIEARNLLSCISLFD
ncbi:hypothetical protein A1D31_37030 [Bradyrhizobium liaoningense]|nr:hypothetical protein A1D31_37030 [Bradyrhizobium liaoningense]